MAGIVSQHIHNNWWAGAKYFESILLDYDPCSNYGIWKYYAVAGQDPINCYFNIVNHVKDFDEKSSFMRFWFPKLKTYQIKFIHEHHKLNSREQSLYSV